MIRKYVVLNMIVKEIIAVILRNGLLNFNNILNMVFYIGLMMVLPALDLMMALIWKFIIHQKLNFYIFLKNKEKKRERKVIALNARDCLPGDNNSSCHASPINVGLLFEFSAPYSNAKRLIILFYVIAPRNFGADSGSYSNHRLQACSTWGPPRLLLLPRLPSSKY